jgi:hypothetical protein
MDMIMIAKMMPMAAFGVAAGLGDVVLGIIKCSNECATSS